MTRRRDLRILVVDDHTQARRGIVLILQAMGTGTCMEARNRRDALTLVRGGPPDVAIVDWSLEGEDGPRLVRELADLQVPVVVCSLHEDQAHVRQALDAGARGYVTKQESRAVARVVRAAVRGWVAISPRAARGLGHGWNREPA